MIFVIHKGLEPLSLDVAQERVIVMVDGLCDGRFWFEGNLSAAIESGWIDIPEGQHICPNCKKAHNDSQ